MDNFIIKRGIKIYRKPEQMAELAELSKMTDDDIDYSDIPPLTDEELKKFKPARLRRKKVNVAG